MKEYSLKGLFFYICLIAFQSNLYSQSSSEIPDLSPPSPNATSFHVYGNNQVKHYTGSADVQIPIFTIEQDGITVPIYLQYTGGNGIKVSEIASWVGLGWTLNYGGAISRLEKGIADDDPNGGYLFQNTLPEGSEDALQYKGICEGTLDGEPDHYSYNFPGGSGGFMFDLDGDVNLKPLNNLSVGYWMDNVTGEEPLASNPVSLYHSVLGGFQIKNTDGAIYRFEEKEYSNSIYSGIPYTDNRGFPSTWYLSKISNYNQNSSIYFEYDPYRYDITTLSGTNTEQIEQEQYTLTTYLAKRIKRISFKRGFIDFVAGTANRKDLNNERYLDKIIVRDKNENIIKQFQFSYQYSTGSSFVDVNSSISVSESNRLILKQVVELGAGGAQEKPPYIFSYSSNKFLPGRNSKAIDHWGYYNGQSNTKFEPQYYFTWYKLDEGWRTDLVGSAIREANPVYAKAGILDSVHYPTGGSTFYQYEGNKVSNYDFLPAEGQKESLVHLSFQNSVQNIDIDQITSGASSVEVNFKSDTYTGTCLPKIFFKNTSTNHTYSVTYGDMSSDIQTTELPLGNYDVWFQLLTGSGQPCIQEDPIIITVRFTTIGSNPDYTGFVGGLRLAAISDSDGKGNSYFKRFEYLKDDNQTTSGILVSNPMYGFVAKDNTTVNQYSVTFRRSQSEYPLLTTQGAYVGYSKITEISGNTGTNLGKSEHYYTTAFEFPDRFHKTSGVNGGIEDPYVLNGQGWTYLYPLADIDHKDYLRGKLLKTKIYENKSGILSLNKQIENTYENAYFDYKDPSAAFEYLRLKTKISNGIKIYSSDCNGSLYWSYYELHTGYSLLKETKETVYTDAGDVVSRKIKKYTKDAYGFIDFYFPESELTNTSTGKSLIRTFKYPKDIVNPSAAESSLLNSNRIVPVDISNYTDRDGNNIPETSDFLSTDYYRYGVFGNGVVEISSIDLKKGNNTIEPRVVYYNYDSFGNPLEFSKKDGPPVVYIWGYDAQYPIAKIENATYQEVASALNVSTTMLDTYDESNLTVINALRNNSSLSKTMVTTYTFEPLVGVKTITDPKGLEITYEYDGFNRLEFIKDADGNIIKEHKYNYKGE